MRRILIAVLACRILGYAAFAALIYLFTAELKERTDRSRAHALTEAAQDVDKFGEAVVHSADEPRERRGVGYVLDRLGRQIILLTVFRKTRAA